MTREEGSLALGSNKFQEETKRNEHDAVLRKIFKSYIDPETGSLKKELIVERNCPICNEKPINSRVIFLKDGFSYRKCKNCSLVYVSPMLKEKVLKEIYEKSEYNKSWMKVLLNPIEQKFNQPKFQNGLKDIEKLSRKKGRILDIGCAVGQFLKVSKDSGWDAIGIELNREEQEYCKKRGFKVLGKPLTDETFSPETFDAATMWEVLEHVPHPRAIIRSIYKNLKKKGVLLVVVPNLDSLAAQILQEKCNMFEGIAHINMFNNITLGKLLESEKFNIVHRTTIISEISVMNNYLNYEHPYFGAVNPLHSIP